MTALTKKFTLTDLRNARRDGKSVAMLTCYDYLSAKLMQEAGVPMLLVGDSAGAVVLGYPTTLPVSLQFLIEITAAVRRGAELAMVIADMPFGSYQQSTQQGLRNALRMAKLSGADCIKIEAGPAQLELVKRLADAGVAVMAHLGLRPQAVGLVGGYRTQGRTCTEALEIVRLSEEMERAGAAIILLEAVPAVVAETIVKRTKVPIIGCGAGASCHGHVVVTPDALGITNHRPKFVPLLAELAGPMRQAYGKYVEAIASRAYPSHEQEYDMSSEEREKFLRSL